MWIPGAAVTIAVTNTSQLLVPLPIGLNLVKAVRLMADPSNAGNIFWGDLTLNITTTPKTGVLGWMLKPTTLNGIDYVWEDDSQNGINLQKVMVAGTANDVVLFSYIIQ